jgi:mono/diheme cytochrome c family protein
MASGLTRFDSNGERIYFAGRNTAGERIRPSGGSPSSGMMMSNSLSCADCHGADARGGLHIMHMQVMQAPDIRWSTLSSGEHGEHGEDERTGEGHAETAYDKEAFMRAVRQGLEPDGHYLSSDMPRWEMSDADLMDLISYLKTLP